MPRVLASAADVAEPVLRMLALLRDDVLSQQLAYRLAPGHSCQAMTVVRADTTQGTRRTLVSALPDTWLRPLRLPESLLDLHTADATAAGRDTPRPCQKTAQLARLAPCLWAVSSGICHQRDGSVQGGLRARNLKACPPAGGR